jgi:Protein of unknown function (DUF4232)
MTDEELREQLAAHARMLERTALPPLSVIRRRARRHTVRSAAVAGLAVVAVLAGVIAGVHAATGASPATRPKVTSPSGMAWCAAGDVAVSIPNQLPDTTMPGTVYALVFRNVGPAACALEGFPQLAISAPRTLRAVRVSYSGSSAAWGMIDVARVVLRPGASAAAMFLLGAPTDAHSCAVPTLSAVPPDSSRALPVRLPRSALAPTVCANDSIQVSPVYPGHGPHIGSYPASATSAPPVFPRAAGREPAQCKAAALRAAVVFTASRQSGSLIVLQLSTATGECAMPVGQPVERVHEAGGTGPMAKAWPDPAAGRAAATLLRSYGRGSAQRTALPLLPGKPVLIAVLSPGGGACAAVRSLSIYPSVAAVGPSLLVTIGKPVSFCGLPRVLPYLPASPLGNGLSIADSALATLSR